MLMPIESGWYDEEVGCRMTLMRTQGVDRLMGKAIASSAGETMKTEIELKKETQTIEFKQS